MPSKRFSWPDAITWKRASIALLLSILLHVLVFGGLNLHLPDLRPQPSLIEARLVLPPTMPVAAVQPAQAVAKPHPVRPRARRHAVAQPEPLPAAPAEDHLAALEPAVTPAVQEVNEHPPITDADPGYQPEAQAAGQDELPQVPEDMPKAPTFVMMEYDLSRGGDASSVGTTQVSYERKQDGSYQLRSETAARGLASLFFPGKLVQTSSGLVTPQGLQPQHFAYEFGDRADKSQHADFDWQAGQLTMHTSKGNKQVALPPGTQDLLSFMYQYMFVPPLVKMQLSVTNGKKLSQYVYSFEGEDTLPTKLGDVRTMHISKSSSEGDEKTELWLAPDYHYLPIKIRKTEKDGKSYEQIVTRLSTE